MIYKTDHFVTVYFGGPHAITENVISNSIVQIARRALEFFC